MLRQGFSTNLHFLVNSKNLYQYFPNYCLSVKSLIELTNLLLLESNDEKEGHTNETRIYIEERSLCTLAKAKYRLDNDASFLKLDKDFERAVCRLSADYDEDKDSYMRLIDNYGTVGKI